MPKKGPTPGKDKSSGAEEAIAAQFPQIERLIETEDFSKINASFKAAYSSLEKIGRGGGGMGKSKDARKAMKAIERIMDLLRDLLKIKYQLVGKGHSVAVSGVSTPQIKK